MDDRWNTKAVPHTELLQAPVLLEVMALCFVWLPEAALASMGPSGAHNCSVAVGRGAWCNAIRYGWNADKTSNNGSSSVQFQDRTKKPSLFRKHTLTLPKETVDFRRGSRRAHSGYMSYEWLFDGNVGLLCQNDVNRSRLLYSDTIENLPHGGISSPVLYSLYCIVPIQRTHTGDGAGCVRSGEHMYGTH